jgi:EAL domain-containing protein (putative c-di-GMP-specific phosphodiesterase class I)
LARAFFDSAPFTLGTCAALLVLDAFGVGRDPLEPAVWLAVFGAVSASTLVAGACVGIADGLGARAVRRPLDTLVGNWLLALGSTSLGLAAAAVVTASPVAGVLLVPPTAALLLANRAYVRERRRSAELGVLYDAARGLSRSSGMRPELDELLERTADLERAVSDHELTVVYQPVVGLEDGRPVALEALVRWNHPERGLVPPGDFIALAEETGVVVQIGKIVLERVAEQAARVGIPIHVNVSAPELTAPGFLGRVDELVARHGLTPDLLVFEVTERLFVAGDPALVAVLEGLKERGMRVAMDDFGTGYSSLACLPRLPVDTMKIPKEITDEVTGGHEHHSLARAVVELGAALNLTVVAEGIEHPDQITALRAFGCDYGQGYFYGRPTDAQVALSRVDLLREAAAA